MTRNEAREIMMQILYEMDATKSLEEERAKQLCSERLPGDHAVRGGRLLSDIVAARLHQRHDRFLMVAVQQVVNDLRRSRVPVENDGVIGEIQPRVARVRAFDKIVEDIGKITDDRSREGDHTDDDDRKARHGQRDARGADILYDRLDTPRVKDHRHRIISGVEEVHRLRPAQRKRADHRGGNRDKKHVEQNDQDQHHTLGVLCDLNTQPTFEFSHTNLLIYP